MTWTATTTWRRKQIVTAANLNTYLSTNLDIANRWSLTFLSTTASTSTGFAPQRWVAPYPLTIGGVALNSSVAPTTGKTLVWDVRYSTAANQSSTAFTTLFTSSSKLPTLSSGQTASTTLPAVTSLGQGDVVMMNLVSGASGVGNTILTISVSGG